MANEAAQAAAAPGAPPPLTIDRLALTRRGRAGAGQPVELADFAVAAGELVALVGPNGSGKSTVLAAALGLRPGYRAEARLAGRPLAALPAGAWRELGLDLPQRDFVEGASVADIVALHRRLWGGDRAELDVRLGVGELARQRYHRLSGGQKQRIKLYTALAHGPAVALLDEPEAALDAAYREVLAEALVERKAWGGASLVATHDGALMARADRLAAFRAGRLMACDGPAAVCDAVLGSRLVSLDFESEAAAARAEQALQAAGEVVRCRRNGRRVEACGAAGLPAWVEWFQAQEAVAAHAVKKAAAEDLAKVLGWG